jgi:hypothetical protein
MRKLNLFFHLLLLMGLNGSIFSLIIHIELFIIFSKFFDILEFY